MKDAKDKLGNSVKILGRSGIIFEDKFNKHYIDSEMSIGEYDFTIFSGAVYLFDGENKAVVPEQKQNEIITMVIRLLLSKNIKVNVI